MRKVILRLTLSLVFALALGSCKDEVEEIVNTEELKAKLATFPNTDTSTSTAPLRDIAVCHWFGMKYCWGGMPFTGINEISIDYQKYFPDSDDRYAFMQKLRCLTTNGAYQGLIDAKSDVIIASRDISRNEKTYAEEKQVEILTTPLAVDGLIFIVNEKNPVSNLTVEQLQKIYTGEITNWKEVGGPDHKITPYQRDVDSGSQEKMETLVMNGLQMMDCPNAMIGYTMFSPYESLSLDEYGICYSPYFYRNSMVSEKFKQKMLSINGVMPSKETLASRQYPFTSYIYAAVRADEPQGSNAMAFFDYLYSAEGDICIDESGYVPMK